MLTIDEEIKWTNAGMIAYQHGLARDVSILPFEEGLWYLRGWDLANIGDLNIKISNIESGMIPIEVLKDYPYSNTSLASKVSILRNRNK